MYKICLSFIILLITSVLGMAQDVEVQMRAPQQVAAGKPFRIEVIVNSQNAKISDPKLNDFEVYGRSQSTSMQIINGDMSVQKSFIYTVVANQPGTYTVPATKATQGGKTYESNSITIKVTEADSEPQQQSNAYSGSHQQNQGSQSGSNSNSEPEVQPTDSGDLFVEVSSNKSEVYVGEQVLLTASLFSRYDIVGFEDAKFPNFNGFWAKDIKNPKNITFDRKRINNKVYLYSLWQKKALFPQKPGTLEIEPYTVNCVITDGFGFRQARAVAKSKTKTIKVKPLPDNKPDEFGGAVGNFKINISSDKKQVKLDEPLTIKVTVSGSGNFQLFETPKIELASAFEQFEPKSSENINATDAGISGSKTFSTVVIARQPGEYTIAPVKFAYFDPTQKSYKTIQTEELTIEVTGERDASQQASAAIVRTDIEDLGTDIRFIKQDGIKLLNGKKQFFNSISFWVIFILIPIIAAAIILFRFQQIKNNANVIGMKNRKAGKTSRKRLKKAAEFAKANNKDAFYVEILNALWGYLSDKLAIPVSELNRENVQETLANKNIEPSVTEKFISTLDTCEFEHYAPESMSHQLNEIYAMAAEAIETMESSIK